MLEILQYLVTYLASIFYIFEEVAIFETANTVGICRRPYFMSAC